MEQFCSRHSHGLWSTYYNTPLSLNEETNFEAFHAGEFLTKIDKKNCTRRGSTFHSEMTMVKMVEEEKKKRGSGFSNAGGEFCIPWDMHCALHRREEKGLTSKFPKEKKKKNTRQTKRIWKKQVKHKDKLIYQPKTRNSLLLLKKKSMSARNWCNKW